MLPLDDPGKALGSPHSQLFGDLRATQPGLRGAALASSGFFTGLLVPGDHVVAGNDLYGGTYRMFTKVFECYGIEFSFVDTTDPDKIKEAMRPTTKYVYIETPSNPLLNLTDIAKAAEIAKQSGICLLYTSPSPRD